jgi:hypothetical protein
MPIARWPNLSAFSARVLARAASGCAVAALAGFGASDTRAQSELWMRGGVAPPPGRVVAIDAQGAVIEAAADATAAPSPRRSIVPWDRVAKVDGALAQEALAWSQLAEDAWRARVRMERGDLLGAEPLLEAAFARYEGTQGPTTAMVASALTRCRLMRDARASGVRSWLALVASGEPEVRFEPASAAGEEAPPAFVDSATALAPDLPPIWLPAPGLRLLAEDGATDTPSADGPSSFAPLARARALRSLYAASAKFELGEPTKLPQRPDSDEGLQLVWDVVASRAGADADRAASLARLRARAIDPGTPAWIEAWCRVAVGRAMVASPDVAERRAGLVHLAHVPARLAEPAPCLAGLALAEMAVAYAKDGRVAEAARIRARLAERFPEHGALAWPPLRSIVAPAPLSAGAASSSPASATSELEREPAPKPARVPPEGPG